MFNPAVEDIKNNSPSSARFYRTTSMKIQFGINEKNLRLDKSFALLLTLIAQAFKHFNPLKHSCDYYFYGIVNKIEIIRKFSYKKCTVPTFRNNNKNLTAI